jgi:hypothetical protein
MRSSTEALLPRRQLAPAGSNAEAIDRYLPQQKLMRPRPSVSRCPATSSGVACGCALSTRTWLSFPSSTSNSLRPIPAFSSHPSSRTASVRLLDATIRSPCYRFTGTLCAPAVDDCVFEEPNCRSSPEDCFTSCTGAPTENRDSLRCAPLTNGSGVKARSLPTGEVTCFLIRSATGGTLR